MPTARLPRSNDPGPIRIPPQNSAIASRLVKEATVAGAIVIEDERVGYKARRYLPAFAAPRSASKK
jgi:hypothetical protein